jgi:hypothetical protein
LVTSVADALAAAQAAVLASEEFIAGCGWLAVEAEGLLEMRGLGSFPPGEYFDQLEAALERFRVAGRPATAADARIMAGTALGTGTILDVENVQQDPSAARWVLCCI